MQNPVDWKRIDYDFFIPELPWVVGGDIAGKVYKVGPGVKDFKVGDRVSYQSSLSYMKLTYGD